MEMTGTLRFQLLLPSDRTDDLEREERLNQWSLRPTAAEIVGSNPIGGMGICLLWALCVVRLRSLRRADHSSRGVLPTVMRFYVWSRRLWKWLEHFVFSFYSLLTALMTSGVKSVWISEVMHVFFSYNHSLAGYTWLLVRTFLQTRRAYAIVLRSTSDITVWRAQQDSALTAHFVTFLVLYNDRIQCG
jgi:hypothetical protein